jgi:hypothetical protein
MDLVFRRRDEWTLRRVIIICMRSDEVATRNHGFAVLYQLDRLAWEWFRGGHRKDVDETLGTESMVHIFDSHGSHVADVYTNACCHNLRLPRQ